MPAVSTCVKRLHELRSSFTTAAAREKTHLLESLKTASIPAVATLKQFHQTLLYLRAFPDNAATLALATEALDGFHERVVELAKAKRERLNDTGIAGTIVHYGYSLDVARWFAKHCPGAVEIDWHEFENAQALDEILSLMLAPAEDPAFSEGDYSTHEWLRLAKGDAKGTDFDWIVRQMQAEPRLRAAGKDLFDEADIPIVWQLGDSAASITQNRLESAPIEYRKGMRRPPANAGRLIASRLDGIKLLSSADGQRVIDVAQAALVARHREVYSMNVGNPAEVWLAPLGHGAQLAVFGATCEARPVLEGNYGYLLLSNGMPIGYGGVSPLFDQGNTGINIFDAYRHSEAAYLFAQTLRAFHTLFGCLHFIANPYQFGAGNAEAIGSGAFWFYYRFGFRPVSAAVRKLAEREHGKIAARRGYRSDKQTLRELAKSDLILSLPGARHSTFFPEHRLIKLSEGATRLIATHNGATRRAAVGRIVKDVAMALNAKGRSRWPAQERDSFARLAPIAAQIRNLASWTKPDKRRLVELMRAKGGADGRRFAQLLGKHKRFRAELNRICRYRPHHAVIAAEA